MTIVLFRHFGLECVFPVKIALVDDTGLSFQQISTYTLTVVCFRNAGREFFF